MASPSLKSINLAGNFWYLLESLWYLVDLHIMLKTTEIYSVFVVWQYILIFSPCSGHACIEWEKLSTLLKKLVKIVFGRYAQIAA